jgi:hypothetical protein
MVGETRTMDRSYTGKIDCTRSDQEISCACAQWSDSRPDITSAGAVAHPVVADGPLRVGGDGSPVELDAQ